MTETEEAHPSNLAQLTCEGLTETSELSPVTPVTTTATTDEPMSDSGVITPGKSPSPVQNHLGRYSRKRTPVVKTELPMKTKASPLKRRKYKKRKGFVHTRTGKKTSVVWHFFRKVPTEPGLSKAQCIICKVIFRNPGGSTTGMRGHLDRKHPGVVDKVLAENAKEEQMKVKREPKIEVSGKSTTPPPPSLQLAIQNGTVGELGETDFFDDGNLSGTSNHILPGPPPETFSVISSDDLTRQIVFYVASSVQPVNVVEDPSFKQLMYGLNSMYMVEVADQESDSIMGPVISALDEVYKETSVAVRNQLKNKSVSLSIKLWKINGAKVNVLISANYVSADGMSQESKFLGLKPIHDVYIDHVHVDILNRKISDAVRTVMEEFEIKRGNVVSVVLDLTRPGNEDSTSICSFETLPCFNEVIHKCYNILNEETLRLTKKNLLEKAYNIAKDFRSDFADLKCHPGRLLEVLKDILENPPLENFQLPVSISDLEPCIQMQEPLKNLIEILLEQPNLIASSIIPLIFGIRQMFEAKLLTENSSWDSIERKRISETILNFFQQSYKIDLDSTEFTSSLPLCTFLDPRYKKLKFFSEKQRESVYNRISELMYEFEEGKKSQDEETGNIVSVRSENPDYVHMNGAPNGMEVDPLTPSTSAVALLQPTKRWTKLEEMMCGVLDKKKMCISSMSSQNELFSYCAELAAYVTHDPLQWWSANGNRYPTLAVLAKRYLSIPLACSSAEQSFTSVDRNLFSQLERIEPEYVNKLYFLKCHQSTPSEPETFIEQTMNGTEADENPGEENDIEEEEEIEAVNIKRETIQFMNEEM